jgi:hypothetical protein
MELRDFYFEDKAQVGEHMPILLPDGSDSGEWLNVISPSADAAVKAGRAFLFAYQAKAEELEQYKEDKTKYAVLMGDACTDLNRQLAVEIVNGWSFTEPFTKEGFQELLSQYSALGNMVADFQSKQRRILQEK